MQPTIILIGPYLAGKSALRQLLADVLQQSHCALVPYHDEALCEHYYRAGGYDPAVGDQIFASQGADGLYAYMKPFEAYAVAQCIADHAGQIIELGAAHVVQEEAALLQRIERALAPHPNVILLLPSPDRAESYRLLRQRYWDLIEIDRNEYYVKHHSNQDLAKQTVYNKGKTPLETRDEILQWLQTQETLYLPIVLIGPPCAGKSTISSLLGVELGLPVYATDTGIARPYYQALGYDEQLAQQMWAEQGFQGSERYGQQFGAALIERLLTDYPQSILDFGAGLSIYEDDGHFTRVQQVLAPYPNIILLLPSPDLDESVQILKERPRGTIHGLDSNLYLLNHQAYTDLAKIVVYTQGKTPAETCAEILRQVVA
jgi:shikimate kinase